MSTPAPKKKVKKKSIRDAEIGDHVERNRKLKGQEALRGSTYDLAGQPRGSDLGMR